jgi:alkylhydroperoxidase family enzyme
LAAWRDSPYFPRRRTVAFALTEAVTRLSDRTDPVPDEIRNEAAMHYDEPTLAMLLIAIANINVWNRLNVAIGNRRACGSRKRQGMQSSRRR